MNKTNNRPQRSRVAWAMAAVFTMALTAFGKGQIFLGPAKSGTWTGTANWFTGAYGAATTSYDFNDTDNGMCAFVISNTMAGRENRADWRSQVFSLGPAAGGARPITFTFAYKLSDRVQAGNNIHVQLRFFDSTGKNFITERVIPIGAHTGDSAMTSYRTLTLTDILAPREARTADVWIDANIFEPWVSGNAHFDDISVTTAPRSLAFKAAVITSVVIGVGASGILVIYFWRQRAPVHK
jgi:hypothetical protein